DKSRPMRLSGEFEIWEDATKAVQYGFQGSLGLRQKSDGYPYFRWSPLCGLCLHNRQLVFSEQLKRHLYGASGFVSAESVADLSSGQSSGPAARNAR
ncbi:MAG: hypothetical protein M3255_11190, partial [Pseudomonadota bacterium]|nr:hypothetical protein [Pseudomonadota bacterium]